MADGERFRERCPSDSRKLSIVAEWSIMRRGTAVAKLSAAGAETPPDNAHLNLVAPVHIMKVAFTLPAASYERLLQNIPQESATCTLLQRIVLPDRRRRARFGGTFNCVLLQCS